MLTTTDHANEHAYGGRKQWGAVIDGKSEVPASLPVFTVAEASTGQELATVVAGDAALVDRAVLSARRAYETEWRRCPPHERAALMRKLAAKIREHAAELTALETREVGKPRSIAEDDLQACCASFEFYAGLFDHLRGDLRDHGAIESRVVYEPYGVVASILPFNWPPIHFGRTVAPALITGNTVVVKPGEQAPLTAFRLTEIANEVLPPGVVNAVTGIETGGALVQHKLVSRICFTGSSATGRKVLKAAADNITLATLELGGKNALIIFEDADLEHAAQIAIVGMFYNQGQACTSTARILVHASLYDAFLERFGALTQSLVVGDGLSPDSEIGPMVDAVQRDRVMGYLDKALMEGARIFAQGAVPTEACFKGGYWVPPTVLVGVTPNSTAGQEEMFGPIACPMPFSTEEEAIAIANDTPYGLTAGIVTANETRAWRVASQLEVGTVFVNNYHRRGAPGVPSGGMKASGYGRDNASETLHEFVRSKSVRLATGRGAIPVWPPRLAR